MGSAKEAMASVVDFEHSRASDSNIVQQSNAYAGRGFYSDGFVQSAALFYSNAAECRAKQIDMRSVKRPV
jgi:hypothetical protein